MLRVTSAALLCALFLASCGSAKKPMVVGSKDETEQTLLGEIVAQHLERRLGGKVERRLGLGNTAILYQSILSGEIGVYPEYTGLIESEILKEQADADPQIVLARVRGQMDMLQLELLDPLGFDDRTVMVVSAKEKIASLSDAANTAQTGRSWKLGLTSEFRSRSDGLKALAPYRLSMEPRILEVRQLYAALEKGDVDMIAGRATDGQLMSPNWKILVDDRDPKVFPAYQACLLVRKELIAAEPGLRPALAELSGKFSAETMRKLNAEVDVEHRSLAAVAADFLTQAGLR
jgi:glycine betaine/choline ABC-type transport system substrate-binding protein